MVHLRGSPYNDTESPWIPHDNDKMAVRFIYENKVILEVRGVHVRWDRIGRRFTAGKFPYLKAATMYEKDGAVYVFVKGAK